MIVNVSSMFGVVAPPAGFGITPYTATKHGKYDTIKLVAGGCLSNTAVIGLTKLVGSLLTISITWLTWIGCQSIRASGN